MNQEEERQTEDHEYDENEWTSNDESEKIEWEQHYKRRNGLLKDDEI